MRIRHAFLLLSLVPFALVEACGGDDAASNPGPDGSVGDTSTRTDTSVPQGDSSTGMDTGSSDSAVGDAADASTPPGVKYECGPDASVSDCTMCTGKTQPCVYCNNVDASTMTGVCTTFHTNCANSAPTGFADCRCGGDASACPESYQICTAGNNGRCHTCSDQPGNNTLTCESSGKCNYADGGCY